MMVTHHVKSYQHHVCPTSWLHSQRCASAYLLVSVNILVQLFHLIAQLSDAGFRLPVAWGNGSWPALRILSVPYSGLHGPLPVTYGANTAFPQLASIELTGNYLTGTLPPAWGNDSSFDFLRLL